MKKSTGFIRLKGLAAASAVGLAGLFGGGSARATATTTSFNVTRGAVTWKSIGGNSSFPSASDVTTTNGAMYSTDAISAFGIRDATLNVGSNAFGDAVDNALLLAVNGNLFVEPTGVVDLTGDVVTSNVVSNIVAGVDAQIQYRFYPARPVVRAMFSLTNTTGSPIAVDPAVLSDYGSDTRTTVRATSDGDTTIENADFWYITDDNNDPDPGFGNDPRITTTRYGAGAAVVPLNALTPDGVAPAIAVSGLRYPTTIAANSTVRILVFMELGDPALAQAPSQATAAADFESTAALDAAGLITDLSPAQRSEVVNYALSAASAPSVPSIPVPIFSPLGTLGLFALLGGLGVFELRRPKRA